MLALALASGVILVLGNMLKPAEQSADASPSPTEIVRLQRLTQRRALEDLAAYFRSLSGAVEPYVWRLQGADRSAVLWSAGKLATSGAPPLVERVTAVGPLEAQHEALISLGGPHLLVAEFELSGGLAAEPAPHSAEPRPFPGEWIMVVWRNEEGAPAYAAGQRLGAQNARCGEIETRRILINTPLNEEMLGAGVFDLEGLLLGLVVWCGSAPAAVAMTEVEEILAAADPLKSRLLQRFGLRVDELTPAEQEHFGVDLGLLVEEVWRARPAYVEGLRPGDIIVAVEGAPANSLDDMEPLVLPLGRGVFEVQAVRRGASQKLKLPAAPEGVSRAGASGVEWRSSETGAAVEAVAADSAAFEAGLRSGDRLLEVNGEPIETTAAGEEALDPEGPRPAFITFQRGDRLIGALLTE